MDDGMVLKELDMIKMERNEWEFWNMSLVCSKSKDGQR